MFYNVCQHLSLSSKVHFIYRRVRNWGDLATNVFPARTSENVQLSYEVSIKAGFDYIYLSIERCVQVLKNDTTPMNACGEIKLYNLLFILYKVSTSMSTPMNTLFTNCYRGLFLNRPIYLYLYVKAKMSMQQLIFKVSYKGTKISRVFLDQHLQN